MEDGFTDMTRTRASQNAVNRYLMRQQKEADDSPAHPAAFNFHKVEPGLSSYSSHAPLTAMEEDSRTTTPASFIALVILSAAIHTYQ
jgi:hypothetical protein